MAAHGIPTLGLTQPQGVGLLGLVGAIAGGQLEELRRARQRKRDLETKENFVAYSARRAQGQNPAQAEATIISLAGLSDRWRVGSLSDQQYSEILDDLLAELPARARAQSYYADFVANGSRAELTTEIARGRIAIGEGTAEFVMRYEDPPEQR